MTTAIKTQFNSASVLAAAFVALVCAAGTGKALAAQPDDVLTKKVAYGDLNLESAQGAKVLYVRLRAASHEVCAPLESIELSRQVAWHECVNNAMDSAVAKIDKPMVSALHETNHSTKG